MFSHILLSFTVCIRTEYKEVYVLTIGREA